MFAALLALAATLLLGAGISTLASTRHKLVLAPVLGALGFSWISFTLSSFAGFSQNEVFLASLVSAASGAGLIYWKKSGLKKIVSSEDGTALKILLAALLVFTLLHNSLLHYDSQGGLHGFLTDFNFHASIASTISEGNFPPQYPFFLSNESLSYYYFPHFYAAHFLAGGADLPTAFLLFSVAIAFICALVCLLAKNFGLSQKASLLAPFLFLSISSLAFLQYFSSSLSAGASLIEILVRPEVSVNLLTYQQGFAFVGVLAQFLLSQAAMPVGLALCLAALLLAVENNFSGRGLAQSLALLVMAVPFHAFLAIAFASVITLQVMVFGKNSWRWQYLPLAFSSALLYIAFFPQKLGSIAQKIFFSFGWMARDKSVFGVAAFWLQNAFFFLVPLAFGWRNLPEKLKQLLVCCVPLFLLVNFISFTPNPWDSGKLLLPAFVLLSIAAAAWVEKLFSNGDAQKIAAIAFVFAACFFTLMVVQTLIQHGSETIFDSEEAAACRQVKLLTDKNSLVLASNGYTCVGALAGRRVFVAEPDQLEANALNATLALEENSAMLRGDCEKIRQWNITHFYDGGTQYLGTAPDYSFFEQRGRKVWGDGKRLLYEIHCS